MTHGSSAVSSSDVMGGLSSAGGGSASLMASVVSLIRSSSGYRGAAWPGILLSDDKVEVPGPRFVQRSFRFPLGHFDPDLGVVAVMRVRVSGMSASAADWKTAIRTVPETVVRRGGEAGFGLFQRLEELGRVGHQNFRLGSQLDFPAGFPQQFHP